MQVGELSICMTAEALWNLTACLRFCIRFQTHKAKLVLQTGLQLTVLIALELPPNYSAVEKLEFVALVVRC